MNWPRPDAPARGDWSWVVYFVQAQHTGLIKIGFTGRLFERVREIAAEYGPVELLGWDGGTSTDERRQHWWWAQDWYSGEWFSPSPELVEYARAHGPTQPYLVDPSCAPRPRKPAPGAVKLYQNISSFSPAPTRAAAAQEAP